MPCKAPVFWLNYITKGEGLRSHFLSSSFYNVKCKLLTSDTGPFIYVAIFSVLMNALIKGGFIPRAKDLVISKICWHCSKLRQLCGLNSISKSQLPAHYTSLKNEKPSWKVYQKIYILKYNYNKFYPLILFYLCLKWTRMVRISFKIALRTRGLIHNAHLRKSLSFGKILDIKITYRKVF